MSENVIFCIQRKDWLILGLVGPVAAFLFFLAVLFFGAHPGTEGEAVAGLVMSVIEAGAVLLAGLRPGGPGTGTRTALSMLRFAFAVALGVMGLSCLPVLPVDHEWEQGKGFGIALLWFILLFICNAIGTMMMIGSREARMLADDCDTTPTPKPVVTSLSSQPGGAETAGVPATVTSTAEAPPDKKSELSRWREEQLEGVLSSGHEANLVVAQMQDIQKEYRRRLAELEGTKP